MTKEAKKYLEEKGISLTTEIEANEYKAVYDLCYLLDEYVEQHKKLKEQTK